MASVLTLAQIQEKHRQRRQRLFARKVCHRCTLPLDSPKYKTLCSVCADLSRREAKKKRDELRKLGLCRCESLVALGCTRCRACLDKQKLYNSRRKRDEV